MLDLEAYFRRIGYSGSRDPTLETLRALHFHHPLAVPFENLDTLLGRAVPLDLPSLQHKLIEQGRGGYCFEQNLLFGHVLEALGFDVVGLVARVLWDRGDDGMRPRTHMLLLVQVDDAPWLADVGFGGLTMTAPLRLTPDVEQATPHETFRVVRHEHGFAIEALLRGVRKTLYWFDLQPQRPIDIEVLNHFVSTHPSSPFLSSLMAGRPSASGRCTLRDNRLTIRRGDGSVEEREIHSVPELRAVLKDTFGIDAPPGGDVEAALTRLIA